MNLTYLIAAFVALTTAAPASKAPYVAVSLFFHIHPPHSFNYEEPAPMELYHLVNFHQAKNVKKVDFELDYHFGVPIDVVECTFYSDRYGEDILGSFTAAQPLIFDTPTTVGSGICYARANNE